jgi:predicted RNA-binding Zn-ribbon protein involved in translation (DUF1610 family)
VSFCRAVFLPSTRDYANQWRVPGCGTRAVPNHSMFPRLLTCDQCGETAIVKAYLPIYEEQRQADQATPEPLLKAMTYMIDCPQCGVRNQNVTADSN